MYYQIIVKVILLGIITQECAGVKSGEDVALHQVVCTGLTTKEWKNILILGGQINAANHYKGQRRLSCLL